METVDRNESVEVPKNPITDNPNFRHWIKLRQIIRDALNEAWEAERMNDLFRVKTYLKEALDFIQMNFYTLSPIPEYGDHMTIDEWTTGVGMGAFIDYDGFGKLATENSMSDITVVPSDLVSSEPIPEWWTHVVWFNR